MLLKECIGQKFAYVAPRQEAHVARKRKVDQLLIPCGIDPLPEDFDMSEVTSEGRFAKRVASWWYKRTGLRMSDILKEMIGRIYEGAALNDRLYIFDFTDRLNWIRGSFGDPGSCFMRDDGSSSASLELMMANDVVALRFWSYDQNPDQVKGIARAWTYQKGDHIVLFNCYGMSGERMGEVLSGWSGLPYHGPVAMSFRRNGVFNNGSNHLLGGEKVEAIFLEFKSIQEAMDAAAEWRVAAP